MAAYTVFLKNQKKRHDRELDLCGIGISKFDVPALYIRSVRFGVDIPQNLFDVYFKTQQIDLNNVMIPFFDHQKIMHPISVNRTFRRLGMKKEKPTGKTVWEMYDSHDFESIRKRTNEEVLDCLKIYDKIANKIYNKKEK